MAVETVGRPVPQESLWTNPKFRAVIAQIVVVVALAAFLAFIINNTMVNLEKRGIATGFEFLSAPAGFDIATSLIDYAPTMTHGRVFVVGLLNTIMVAVVGIIFATLLGFTVGVLRLSHNWLVARVAYLYVESLRNIPLLLQILFWWAFLLNLPQIKDAISLGGGIYISNRGVLAPTPIPESGFNIIPIAFIVGIVISIVFAKWARAQQEKTGTIYPVWTIGGGLIIGLPLLAAVITGFPLSFEIPVATRFGFTGGFFITPEFFALWFALTVYTAAFIAEIVRSGIQAVSHGQTEAASALGLKPNWTMRLIVVPQALRIIVPPLTSQYLNLTKNSSLAIAIGFPDLVATFGNTTMNQTGQAIEVIMLTMLVYLALSLLTSMFMNWYNKKIALVER